MHSKPVEPRANRRRCTHNMHWRFLAGSHLRLISLPLRRPLLFHTHTSLVALRRQQRTISSTIRSQDVVSCLLFFEDVLLDALERLISKAEAWSACVKVKGRGAGAGVCVCGPKTRQLVNRKPT